ncbi:hypothetical protein [Dankookia sp. P2]|uniref:hypothetical protein n=1 Tax=Dankookia sp. P2 TaxID=3423955 RepID=UPI003D67AFC5
MDLTTTLGLLGFLGACFVAASTGAFFKPGPWYESWPSPPGGRRIGCSRRPGRCSTS